MTSHLRLVLLVLTLAYSLVFGSGHALAGEAKTQRTKTHRLRIFVRGSHLAPPRSLGFRAVNYAKHLLGSPYRYGGSSPRSGFDCSGFVRFVYAHFGLNLPHSSYADFDLGTRVTRGKLTPGDLVFFDSVGHVGMYVGHGRFIHAPHTGLRVQISSLNDPWYRSRYDGARRIFAGLSPKKLLYG